MTCPFYPDPSYFIYATGVPELLYYSHFTSISIALIIGIYVFVAQRENIAARTLFLLSLSFSMWAFFNLIVWTNNDSHTITFIWSFFGILYSLICILSLYFVYVFINGKDVTFKTKIALSSLLLPTLLFAPSKLNFDSFNLTLCSITDDKFLYSNYYFFSGFFIFIWIFIYLVRSYRLAKIQDRTKILLLGTGIELFLFTFFITGYIPGLLLEDSFSLEFYGLFAMTFFMGMLGYLIVRFKAFDVKLIASQALVVALSVLIGSQYFFVDTTTGFVLTTITFILSSGFGYLLVRSVKREVKQKEQIEQLASGLELANDQLKTLDKMKSEFVSIASHQLRSPLTSIRGYSSMLLEGSFGTLPAKAKEAIDHIHEASRFMASSVEDYLNVSRIQAGNMKYEYSDFNIKDLAERVADDTRQLAIKKGLLLTFKSDLTKTGIVHADIGKTRQVIDNLINNSLKYTPKGSISIFVHDNAKLKKVYVDVVDTGIGMNPNTLENIFGKFERASNANEVNVTGTGLGLYIARKMAREMGGEVTALSEGENKGSTFRIELPLMM